MSRNNNISDGNRLNGHRGQAKAETNVNEPQHNLRHNLLSGRRGQKLNMSRNISDLVCSSGHRGQAKTGGGTADELQQHKFDEVDAGGRSCR